MIINDPSGNAAAVFTDGKLNIVGATEGFMHELAEIGKAWCFSSTIAVVSTTDNPIFHMFNGASDTLDIHGITISSNVAGLATIEINRTYSSGGTLQTLRQLNTSSGQTTTLTVYVAPILTLAGTAINTIFSRVPVNQPIDLLSGKYLLLSPNTTFAVKFQADSQPATVALTVFCHGAEPWE